MIWTEVQVRVPVGWSELVADALAAAGCTGAVWHRPPGEPADAEHELLRAWREGEAEDAVWRDALAADLDGLAAAAGAPELAGLAPHFRVLAPEDWARSWEKVWKPFRVGRLCVVRPATRAALRATDVRLALEPGGVFGTGRHATTRACLRMLQDRVGPGLRVLDAGCGTGILGVAAALLGAERVLGFDLDPRAEGEATELARANGVADRCRFLTGDFDALERAPAGFGPPFDGLVANLYADLIQSHARTLRDLLAPGGWFVFSGCPESKAAATRAAVAAAGLAVREERRTGRWHTIAGARDA